MPAGYSCCFSMLFLSYTTAQSATTLARWVLTCLSYVGKKSVHFININTSAGVNVFIKNIYHQENVLSSNHNKVNKGCSLF